MAEAVTSFNWCAQFMSDGERARCADILQEKAVFANRERVLAVETRQYWLLFFSMCFVGACCGVCGFQRRHILVMVLEFLPEKVYGVLG